MADNTFSSVRAEAPAVTIQTSETEPSLAKASAADASGDAAKVVKLEKKIQMYDKLMGTLKAENVAFTSENQSLVASQEALSAEKSKLAAEKAQLEKELSKLKEAASHSASASDEVDSLKKKCIEKDAFIKEMDDAILKLKAEAREAKTSASSEIESLEAKLADMDKQIQEKDKAYSKLKSDMASYKSSEGEGEARLAEAAALAAAAVKARTEVESRLSAAESELKELGAKLQAAEVEKANAQAALSAVAKARDELSASVSEKDGTVKQLAATVSTLREQVTDHANAILSYQQEKAVLTNELVQAKTLATENAAAVNRLSHKYQEECGELQVAIRKVTQAKEAAEARLGPLEQQMASLLAAAQASDVAAKSHESKAKDAAFQLEQLNKQVDNMKDLLDAVRKEKDDATARLKETTKAEEAARATAEVRTREAKEAQAKVGEARAEVAKANEKAKAAGDEVTAAKRREAALTAKCDNLELRVKHEAQKSEKEVVELKKQVDHFQLLEKEWQEEHQNTVESNKLHQARLMDAERTISSLRHNHQELIDKIKKLEGDAKNHDRKKDEDRKKNEKLRQEAEAARRDAAELVVKLSKASEALEVAKSETTSQVRDVEQGAAKIKFFLQASWVIFVALIVALYTGAIKFPVK